MFSAFKGSNWTSPNWRTRSFFTGKSTVGFNALHVAFDSVPNDVCTSFRAGVVVVKLGDVDQKHVDRRQRNP